MKKQVQKGEGVPLEDEGRSPTPLPSVGSPSAELLRTAPGTSRARARPVGRPRTNAEKLAFARRLLQEVHCDERGRRLDKKQREINAMRCQCGHTRGHHLPSTSINYTEGMCKHCKCQNFLIAN